MNVKHYIRPDGSNPYLNWFSGLNSQDKIKVFAVEKRLEKENLPKINETKWFRGIGERKIKGTNKHSYRIYLLRCGKNSIMLLGGGTKESQQSDIDKAVELYEEYKKRRKK